MKTRLDQFTMSQFIDIACGNYQCIEAPDELSGKAVAMSLISQYREIATPAQAKALIVENESVGKRNMRLVLLRVCLNLMNAFSAYDEVRDILKQAGIGYRNADNAGLKVIVEQMIRKDESAAKRYQEEKKKEMEELQGDDEQTLRSSYDTQTAQLMTHFKMSIDHNTVSASIYANLVAIAHRQMEDRASK